MAEKMCCMGTVTIDWIIVNNYLVSAKAQIEMAVKVNITKRQELKFSDIPGENFK